MTQACTQGDRTEAPEERGAPQVGGPSGVPSRLSAEEQELPHRDPSGRRALSGRRAAGHRRTGEDKWRVGRSRGGRRGCRGGEGGCWRPGRAPCGRDGRRAGVMGGLGRAWAEEQHL